MHRQLAPILKWTSQKLNSKNFPQYICILSQQQHHLPFTQQFKPETEEQALISLSHPQLPIYQILSTLPPNWSWIDLLSNLCQIWIQAAVSSHSICPLKLCPISFLFPIHSLHNTIIFCWWKLNHVMYTLLYWITNKALLYSPGSSPQCYVAAWMEEEFGGEWMLSSFAVHLKLSQHC